ncbi:dTDP-4-dehydrorhamnose 3,5-epimerase family protein [Patescibacteria group bacterium]
MKNDPNYKDSFVEKTDIEGLVVIHKTIFEDFRGYFREALKLSTLEKTIGKPFNIKTWNHSVTNPGILRGIHSETAAKLLYPTHGRGFIFIIDLRPNSKTFSKYVTFEVNEKEEITIYKDMGMGVGVLASGEKPFEYHYLMDKEYDQLEQLGVMWNDPDIGITYPIKDLTISERDKTNPTLRELFPEKFK